MPTPVRIGVIGAGRIGAIHARNLATRVPGAQLAWVVDVNGAAAEAVARECGAANAGTDPARVLADPQVDAVVIASATNTHASLIAEAATAGKDVFCEKPIDMELGPIDRALDAVQRAGVKLQVGFNRRFDPGFAKARRLVREGGIGVPQLVRITSRDPQIAPLSYLEVSGGLFKDMTIHDFDMARWILGEEVQEVFAMASVMVEPEIRRFGDVDTAIVSLKYGSGALGAIDNSRRAVYGYDVRLEVFGSEGMVAVGNQTATPVVVAGTAGVTGEGPLHWFVERFEDAYVAELIEFVACAAEDRAPSVTGEDGRVPILMAEAARRSVDERRPVAVEHRTPAGRT